MYPARIAEVLSCHSAPERSHGTLEMRPQVWQIQCAPGNSPHVPPVRHTKSLQEAKLGKHVRILGWLHIALGVIDLLIGMAAFGLLSGIGVLSGDVHAFGTLSLIGSFAGAMMLLMALPNLLCGLGLLRNWGGWVIVLAVILGIFNLTHFPVGTAIALYTFWIAWKLYDAQADRV